jgi:hypothetical protein
VHCRVPKYETADFKATRIAFIKPQRTAPKQSKVLWRYLYAVVSSEFSSVKIIKIITVVQVPPAFFRADLGKITAVSE